MSAALEPRHFENVHRWDDLPTRLNKLHRIVQDYAGSAIEAAQQLGELLIEAKKSVGHGNWLSWLSENVAFGERTARNYMRVARALPKLEHEDRQRVADLSFRDLLGALVTDTNRLAKLPEPGAVLLAAETKPLRHAVVRASTAARVRHEQQQPAPLVRESRAEPEPMPEKLLPGIVELRDGILGLARQAMDEHCLAINQVLDVLNDAYYMLQEPTT